MKKTNFKANISFIREVWNMNRAQFGKVLGVTEHQITNQERLATNIPPSILFNLEDLTGIPARRLYYDRITWDEIPRDPLTKSDIAEKKTLMSTEGTPQYNGEELTQLERIVRLERKVFGGYIEQRRS
jgi:hypothetical protein